MSGDAIAQAVYKAVLPHLMQKAGLPLLPPLDMAGPKTYRICIPLMSDSDCRRCGRTFIGRSRDPQWSWSARWCARCRGEVQQLQRTSRRWRLTWVRPEDIAEMTRGHALARSSPLSPP